MTRDSDLVVKDAFHSSSSPFSPPRKLVGKGEHCSSQMDCDGLLNCCFGIAEGGDSGLCYYTCDATPGQWCSSHEACGTTLKCCNGQCVAGGYAKETCLTPQQQLNALRNELFNRQWDSQNRKAALSQYLAQPPAGASAAEIAAAQKQLQQLQGGSSFNLQQNYYRNPQLYNTNTEYP